MSRARVTWIGGPVLRARMEGPFSVYEALSVGPSRLLGEVIQLRGDELVAQVYEDTTGLEPGEVVEGSGRALSVPLGPGLLGGIFDGLLRPLIGTQDYQVRPGIASGTMGRFHFVPAPRWARRSRVDTRSAASPRRARSRSSSRRGPRPPRMDRSGRRLRRRRADRALHRCGRRDARVRDAALLVRAHASSRGRQVARERTDDHRPADPRHAVPRGARRRATLPGGFGTGKTVLQEALAKWCDAEVIVYVGCGERGNEMAEVLDEFPKLDDPRSGRPLAERTVIIATHVEHAGGRARGEHLHGDLGRRVFPRPGTARRVDGRFDQPLAEACARSRGGSASSRARPATRLT